MRSIAFLLLSCQLGSAAVVRARYYQFHKDCEGAASPLTYETGKCVNNKIGPVAVSYFWNGTTCNDGELKYYTGEDCTGREIGHKEDVHGATEGCVNLPNNPLPGVTSSYEATCTEGEKECKNTEYCCPDAKHCLTPTKVSCVDDANACSDGQVCCPLTKICVVPGAVCTSPCSMTEYCCPDALHCLTPTNPGKFCTGGGTQGSCSSGEVCCPITFECVTVGAACTPP